MPRCLICQVLLLFPEQDYYLQNPYLCLQCTSYVWPSSNNFWVWELIFFFQSESFIFQRPDISKFPRSFVEDSVFYPMHILGVFIKNQAAAIVWSQIQVCTSIPLVYASVSVPLSSYSAIRDLWYIGSTQGCASSGGSPTPTPRIRLTTLGVLCFHIHFEFCFVFLCLWRMALGIYWHYRHP